MPFDSAHLIANVQNFIVLLLSLTVHEFFHAWTAWKLGDDTAARAGRLTLNPIVHADLFGTVLLPLLGAPIGWAKPVPVNPANFRRGVRMTTGDILVSVAGPLSNLGLALVAGVVFGVLLRFAPETVVAGSGGRALLTTLMWSNVGLAVFNLLPLPPLDGSHVVGGLLPDRLRAGWAAFSRYGMLLLLALVIFGQGILLRVIGPPIDFLVGGILQLVRAIAA